MALLPPGPLEQAPLAVVKVDPRALYRISWHDSGEPWFGVAASNRFDDPSTPPPPRYGTCYCGFDLSTAIAETVLHDEVAVAGAFPVARADFEARHLVRFHGDSELIIADLTGAALKRLGCDGSLSTFLPYDLPQQWSLAIHRHPDQVDGIQYISRQINDRKAVVIFHRAKAKRGGAQYVPLGAHPATAAARAELNIVFATP